MFFELNNGKVEATQEGLLNTSLKMLFDSDHSKGKEKFSKMASYIYSVYDKRSMYKNIGMSDRRKLVCDEVLQDKNYWVKAEANPDVQNIIAKQDVLQFTHKERLLEGVKRKIDEYIDYFDTMKISDKNYKDYSAMVKGSEDLIDFFDKLESKVNKEAMSRQVGDADSKLFEENG
jgi:hypothetical protein